MDRQGRAGSQGEEMMNSMPRSKRGRQRFVFAMVLALFVISAAAVVQRSTSDSPGNAAPFDPDNAESLGQCQVPVPDPLTFSYLGDYQWVELAGVSFVLDDATTSSEREALARFTAAPDELRRAYSEIEYYRPDSSTRVVRAGVDVKPDSLRFSHDQVGALQSVLEQNPATAIIVALDQGYLDGTIFADIVAVDSGAEPVFVGNCAFTHFTTPFERFSEHARASGVPEQGAELLRAVVFASTSDSAARATYEAFVTPPEQMSWEARPVTERTLTDEDAPEAIRDRLRHIDVGFELGDEWRRSSDTLCFGTDVAIALCLPLQSEIPTAKIPVLAGQPLRIFLSGSEALFSDATVTLGVVAIDEDPAPGAKLRLTAASVPARGGEAVNVVEWTPAERPTER